MKCIVQEKASLPDNFPFPLMGFVKGAILLEKN